MPTYDASDADVFIYTRRDSDALLSSMGHDLKIRAGEFEIDADFEAGEVRATFQADSLEPVDSVIWESKEETGELSDGDRHEISQRMSTEVLDVEDFPEIVFESTSVEETDAGWQVEGTLVLHGEEHGIDFEVERRGDRAVVETTFDYTDFEMEPYSAMMGSLKVEPEVAVEVRVPVPSDSQ